jgi:subtilisin-like proprotein convertase family protein
MRLATLAAAAVAVSATVSLGAAYTQPGGPIPDNQPGNPLTIVFSVTENETVTDLWVSLDSLAHTWAGDLIVTLTAPNGTLADIMRRPEDTSGFVATGDSSDFNGSYRFIDSGASLATGLAGGLSTFILPSGDYAASTRTSPTTGNVPVSLAGTFAGVPSLGDWTLRISDNASLDTGTLGSATLTLRGVPIPEPTTLGLLAGAAVLGLRRRA